MSEHETTTTGFEQSDPDWYSTAVTGIVGIVLLYGIIVAVEALYAQTSRREFDRKVVQEAPIELKTLRATQLEAISRYRVLDPKAGTVAVPIERAMEILVEERRAAAEARTAR